MRRLTLARRRAAHQDGYTVLAVMAAMITLMSLTVAGYAASGGELHLGQRNVDEKRAYAAAEAGVAYYLQKLGQDNDYWTLCANDPNLSPDKNPVNQPWRPASASEEDPRNFVPVPGSGKAEFTIELLPNRGVNSAPGVPPICLEGASNNDTMIDPGGTLRIRATGVAGPASSPVKRSVVTAMRRKGFLDFVYFTDFETLDPGQQKLAVPNDDWEVDRSIPLKRPDPVGTPLDQTPTETIAQWATDPRGCSRYQRRDPNDPASVERDAVRYPGFGYFDPPDSRPTGWWPTAARAGASGDIRCGTIRFGSTDEVKGPFHSNDSILICGAVPFGRNANDRIEFYAARQETGSGCSGSATYSSTPVQGANLERLTLPQTNEALMPTTFAPYRYSGRTEITLNETTMTVRRAGETTTTTQPLPSNGLIYVRNHPTLACDAFDILRPNTVQTGCGDVIVRGTYAKSLTIAAKRDVIISGDLRQKVGSDAVLGLIAEHYVRVEHKMTGSNRTNICPEGTSNASTGNRRIEAAMLSLTHIFTVDNYQCGNGIGTLEIRGAIGQRYRGPVKRGASGYVKDYRYDDRLRFRSPPYFLTPIEAAWRVVRINEQGPAR